MFLCNNLVLFRTNKQIISNLVNRIIGVMQRPIVCFLSMLLGCGTMANAQDEVPLVKLDALEERIAKGGDTTFVINLWATWCIPCVAELPHFEQLQQTHRDSALEVILLSLDAPRKQEAVANFRKEKGLRNEVFILNERNQQQYIERVSSEWSGVIPATLFINPAKDIRILLEQAFDFGELNQTYLSIVNP